jgi:hypothetical protein
MGMNVVRQLQGELIAKLRHCQNHIRPQGVKTGQYPRAYKNKSAPKPVSGTNHDKPASARPVIMLCLPANRR